MLFILLINYISNITVNGVLTKLFADNLKLYTSLISTDVGHNLLDVLSILHLHKNNSLMDCYLDGNLFESCNLVFTSI